MTRTTLKAILTQFASDVLVAQDFASDDFDLELKLHDLIDEYIAVQEEAQV